MVRLMMIMKSMRKTEKRRKRRKRRTKTKSMSARILSKFLNCISLRIIVLRSCILYFL